VKSHLTVAETLRAGTRTLADAGIPDPARDARRLLAHALRIPSDRLTLAMADRLPMEAAARYDSALWFRTLRQPVSQITGQRLFWGRPFRVTRDTLDPRPETETLIAAALEAPFTRLLDLGTGTGAILLTLLAERPGTEGTGTDLSPPALAVAAQNAAALNLSPRLIESDWFSRVTGRFDLIVSNPPYIPAQDMPALAPEVREWEPRSALTDEGDGLRAYRAIAADASDHLLPGGRLMVEVGAGQAADVAALFAAAGLAVAGTRPDMDGRPRVVIAALR